MKLPNADQAVVDIVKLTEYCLNDSHPRGRHKARVFRAALGFTSEDAEFVRDLILAAARRTEQAELLHADFFGQRYRFDFMVEGPFGLVNLRTAWIIRQNEDFPRLTTCHVL